MITLYLSALVFALAFLFRKLLIRLLVTSPIDNIPGPTPKSFLKGAFGQVFNPDAWDFHREIAETYGSVIKIRSFLGDNWLYIFDPKALHHIVVKEQYVFEETDGFIQGNKLAFGEGLLGTLGEQHRKQRKMLNPVFSIAHMREMIPIFYDVGHKLRGTLLKKVKNGPQEIDVLYWMSRTALELIGQSGIGYSFDDLTEERPPHEYAAAYKQFVPASFKFFFIRNYFLPTLVKIGTPKLRRYIVDLLPGKDVQDLKSIIDIMHDISVMIYESKKKAIAEGDAALAGQIGRGKDIMSILMRANMSASAEDSLTEDEVIGQMSTLTAAATDTTSNALARVLHLLAQNQDAQEKLRREISEAKGAMAQFDYDQLVSLPYLDAICRETLRLYSPVSMIPKTARKDTVLPLSNPIKGLDGSEIREIPIPANTNVIVGIMASNRNPELWGPDSYEWKPERWLKPLPDAVSQAHLPGVYSNLMTFLGGGRACIGFKFSQLEMKVILSLLIENFRFSLSDKEIYWQMFGVSAPTVRNSAESGSQLPLIVERI
ncbi:cytochrome P450 [Agrocybe pediades]|nr:cytochrome P450 [Agrocybe pediades]